MVPEKSVVSQEPHGGISGGGVEDLGASLGFGLAFSVWGWVSMLSVTSEGGGERGEE